MRVEAKDGNLNVYYTEPSTNADGTPLNDLSHTMINLFLDDVPMDPIYAEASSPQGGQEVSHTILIGKTKRVYVDVRAVDTNGNVSEKHVTSLVVDEVPPAHVN